MQIGQDISKLVAFFREVLLAGFGLLYQLPCRLLHASSSFRSSSSK
jgi:hypothetical protein